jgi:N-acetyl-gamma-glutamyl-phosphate reductase
MTHKCAIVGASGYTGAELLRLVAGHPELELVVATAASNEGARVAELYPSLAPAYGDLRFAATDDPAVAGAEVVFCGLPHGESQRLAAALSRHGGHLVDLGADFRLPAPVYEQWYGEAHVAPELLDGFAYGLVELFRDRIRASRHVAVPGCYPTAASLALAPLLAGGLVEPTGIVVDAVSGVSGAGRGLKTSSMFAELDESVSAYGLLHHRHTAEMEMVLSQVGGTDVQVLFTPHLVPMTRGILATCYARPAVAGLTTDALLDRYREFYAGEQFVVVSDQPPPTKAARGGNAAHLTVRFDPRTGTVVALGAIDNLVKGASGQAVQCANLVLGLDEGLGLSALGVMP